MGLEPGMWTRNLRTLFVVLKPRPEPGPGAPVLLKEGHTLLGLVN